MIVAARNSAADGTDLFMVKSPDSDVASEQTGEF